MKCERCGKSICFFKAPFGAYFCKNEHVQCAECDLTISYCASCDEATKYKSPHFIDEQTSDPKELERAKLQIPTVTEILPAADEVIEFQKLCREYTLGEPERFLGLKTGDEPGTVRTLSAIVTKNLYSQGEEKSKAEIAESISHDLRLERIIRALRETRCSNDDKELMQKSTKYQQSCTETSNLQESPRKWPNLLTPTHSKSQTNEKTITTKIRVEVETLPEQNDEDVQKTKVGAENNAFDGKKTKSLFCPHLVERVLPGFPITIESSSLDRRPFNCPLGSCGCKIFISELNNHITLDHPSMGLSHMKVGQFREFSIDIASCENYFTPFSVACFLLKDIVVNYGTSPLKDVLPIFLMVGRYTSCDTLDKKKVIMSGSKFVKSWSDKDFFLIWLAGVIPDRCEIVASISVFSQKNSTQSVRWYVDKLNSIQAIKDVETTFNGCERLILTYPELKLLTNNLKEMLQCQVGVISCGLKKV